MTERSVEYDMPPGEGEPEIGVERNVSVNPQKTVERSVDSLQQVYAFVVALAVARSVEAAFVVNGELVWVPERIPLLVAFVFTVVPFFHGMNRHLDRCYVERRDEHVRGALLADFSVFFLEAALLFALATSIRSGLEGFLILAALLTVDTIWGVVTHWIHYRDTSDSTLAWAMVNAVFVVLIILVYFLEGYADQVKPWILSLLAVVRTVVDYKVSWAFYFPPMHPRPESIPSTTQEEIP